MSAGTAPAVATLFRDPSGKGRFVEVAIWQSWVWFTKIKLDDPYGYCGGLRVTPAGLKAKPKDAFKIPHHQVMCIASLCGPWPTDGRSESPWLASTGS
eukprot:scaffold328852_cov57-Tisochrysis_lutea.AAC.2